MKDQVFTVEKLVNGGYGIVREGSHTIFVPYVIPGEEITLRTIPGTKNPTRGKVVEIIKPSPDRVDPPCPLFGSCGGCVFQHTSYEAQLVQKQAIVAETLARIGNLKCEVGEVIPSENPWNYRSRIKMHIKDNKPGFFAEDKAEFVEVHSCNIAHDSINDVIGSIGQLILKINPDTIELFKGLDGKISAFCDGYRGYQLDDAGKWHEDKNLRIKFAQVNRGQNEKLRSIVAGICSEISPGLVIELYAGDGNLTQAIVPHCEKVVAVESDLEAVKSGIDKFSWHVKFVHSKAEDYLPGAIKMRLKPEIILLDPPRTGAMDAVRLISELKPDHIIYVSCDAATLARDIKELAAEGYKVSSVTPLDMFPQTAHIELVTTLAKAP